MKRCIALIAACVISGTSYAADIDSTEYTCSALRALIVEEGSVIIGGSRRTRVFGSPTACNNGFSAFGRDLKAQPEICPTSDKRFCNAGFKCVVDRTSDDN